MGTESGHTATCRRPEHDGPCDGPLRIEGSETPAEAAQRREDAFRAGMARGGVEEARIAREVGF